MVQAIKVHRIQKGEGMNGQEAECQKMHRLEMTLKHQRLCVLYFTQIDYTGFKT